MKFLYLCNILVISFFFSSNLIVSSKKSIKNSQTQGQSQSQAEPQIQTQVQDYDCYKLAELFNVWNNSKRIYWNPTIDGSCCDDYNIVCNSYLDKKRIVELKLKNFTFYGDMTDGITQLKYLNNISLEENNFTSLPQNLNKLIYLTKFVKHNSITGKIPDNIGEIDGIFHL
ncbi:hypothetical protein BCR36DRAFT_289221 [Piromyces finnis]|uniref:L domain-like protein n=1 Tax=Piromyces finnis TaxID=1754191 RepID=A0A1Y1V9L3_9FUNG|nr:hypothetical protein BCR36DRAFT_289221 [Piromyces finnis]|eukprot:ORX50660.1 hypothetical protein BCR36DRAFT_289221 [Piromyces finnis]